MRETNIRVVPTLDALRARREEILRIAQQHKAYNVRVFGSVARGEARPDSDIDILVNFGKGASLYDLSGLQQELRDLLEWEVDVVEDHPGLRERFRQRITQDVVTL